jgi:hypothetical protein
MPLRYKIPAYAGNALLLLLAMVIVASGNLMIGVALGALAVLDLYLVYKLDQFSREEVWLQHELEVAKLREELLIAQKRIKELEGAPGDRRDGESPRRV